MRKVTRKEKTSEKQSRYLTVFFVFLGFLAMIAVLLVERHGMFTGNHDFTGNLLSWEELSQLDVSKPVSENVSCLFLTNSEDAESAVNAETIRQVLLDMRVPAEEIDVSSEELPEDLSGYRTVVVTLSDLDALGTDVLKLCDYVEGGGRLLFSAVLAYGDAYISISQRLGEVSAGNDYKTVHGFKVTDGFMIGGDSRIYTVSADAVYESASSVDLDEECTVYVTDSEEQTPLIWKRAYGDGYFVVCNFGYTGKVYRGLYAAAYSLLEDVCVWPVINASSFYLDDFPAPVPSGDSTYIERDYGMDTATFYAEIWWPDILEIAKTYGIRYTGLIIENYGNQVSGALPRNQNVTNHRYFGNMLLRQNGELGFHGYNHQPLVTKDFVYRDGEDYKKWESTDEIQEAMNELYAFSSAIFPSTSFDVYAPPSNILSEKAREMIGDGKFPGVRAVASTYQTGGDVYEQEFGVAEDGIVETPRVISGCVFNEFNQLAAFSELNFHFVNSHFMHPDDLLDVGRGAELGWEELKTRLTGYLDDLTEAAPSLQMTNGSEMAGRVQRFSALYVDSLEETERGARIAFAGLFDEAWCLVRCNRGTPSGSVSGGELTHITGNLYLLHVTSTDVVIPYQSEG